MKKLLAAALMLLPSFCFADRLGSLRSAADVLLTSQAVTLGGVIHSTDSLQTGSTFYVSSGTVAGTFSVNGPGPTLIQMTIDQSTTTVLSSSVPLTVGQFLMVSSTRGVAVSAVAGVTPGGTNSQVQYNSGGSLAGSNNFQFNGTSTTFVSSVTINTGGSDNSNPGLLNIFSGTGNFLGRNLVTIGTQGQQDQVIIKDRKMADFSHYGMQGGSIGVGDTNSGWGQRIYATGDSNAYLELRNGSTVTLNSGTANGPGDIRLQPASTLLGIFSTQSGVTLGAAGSTVTVTDRLTVNQPSSGNVGLDLISPSPGVGNPAYVVEFDGISAGIPLGYLGYTNSSAGTPGGFSIFNNSKAEMMRFANTGGVWLDEPGGLLIGSSPSTSIAAPANGLYVQTGIIASTMSLTEFTVSATSLTARGALNMSTNQINNVTDPSVAQDAATKNYVDTQVGVGGVIKSQSFLQAGSTAYPDFLTVGTSASFKGAVQFNGTQFNIGTGTYLTDQDSATYNGNVYISSGLYLNLSAGTANSVAQSNGTGYPPTWTRNIIQQTVTATTGTFTGGLVIPTYSQNFGVSNLGNWFTAIANNQNLPIAGPNNQIAWLGIGDSHMSDNNIERPFVANLQSNFGNVGELVPVSNVAQQNLTMRPNGCTGYSVNGQWSSLNQQAGAHGLDDDELHSVSTGSAISATCPGADQVIFHYIKQPNGGTIYFTVDGGNLQTLPTANGTTVVASATISGLGYGMHTASMTYSVLGTGGVNALDFVFYSTGTPGFINYRAGGFGSTAGNLAAQNAAQYQSLLSMLPVAPQVVTIAFGTNEGKQNVSPPTMINNIHTILSNVRASYPKVNCVYMTEPDYLGSGANTFTPSQYAAAMSSAAVADHCAFIDYTAYFSSQPVFSSYYQADGTHLNAAGGYVAGNLMINTFSNQSANITPFSFSQSSSVVSWGTNLSTGNYSNVVNLGWNNSISTGAVNSGIIGNNLSVSTSNIVVMGGFVGSGKEQNLIVTTVTVSGIVISNHIISTGTISTVPTVANNACGTTSQGVVDPNSTDLAGFVTAGTITPASCAVTFASPFINPPICIIADNSTAVTADISAVSTTGFTASLSAGASGIKIYWICFGAKG